jgi:UDP-N-acetylglucosamine 2-epimerase (non-hydrolysing)
MKAAPLLKEFKRNPGFKPILVHTGQHYDHAMSEAFFKELQLPPPAIYLGVGSGTQAVQTGKIMIKFERACLEDRPDLVMVVGDVNSTLACSLTAAKLRIPLAHVEAGLRSFDRTMPEEINRILTDQLADFLFTTCEEADENLIKEGIPKSKIFFVGNVMIDTLLTHLRMAQASNVLERLGIKGNNAIKKYALLTLHRPSNVDQPIVLKRIFGALQELAEDIPIIFPAHPRTLKQIRRHKLMGDVFVREKAGPLEKERLPGKILLLPPLGYLDMLSLLSQATFVLTDSGGIQEETTILGVPCLTLRENTERPITVREGTNTIVGNQPDRILKAARSLLKGDVPKKRRPRYWDGKAAVRIMKILQRKLLPEA